MTIVNEKKIFFINFDNLFNIYRIDASKYFKKSAPFYDFLQLLLTNVRKRNGWLNRKKGPGHRMNAFGRDNYSMDT